MLRSSLWKDTLQAGTDHGIVIHGLVESRVAAPIFSRPMRTSPAETKRPPRGSPAQHASSQPLRTMVLHSAARPAGYGVSGRCSADAPLVPTLSGSAGWPCTCSAGLETPGRMLMAKRTPVLDVRTDGASMFR
jgi:hypothetical protein